MSLVPSTTAEAIYSLRQCQLTINPSKALDYLEVQLNTYQLLALYQHFFPAEWANSQASLYLPFDTVNSKAVSSENRHSPRELEFITLVYTYLFPMSFWAVETAQEERLQAIPITSMGIDWQIEEGIENLRKYPRRLRLNDIKHLARSLHCDDQQQNSRVVAKCKLEFIVLFFITNSL